MNDVMRVEVLNGLDELNGDVSDQAFVDIVYALEHRLQFGQSASVAILEDQLEMFGGPSPIHKSNNVRVRDSHQIMDFIVQVLE